MSDLRPFLEASAHADIVVRRSESRADHAGRAFLPRALHLIARSLLAIPVREFSSILLLRRSLLDSMTLRSRDSGATMLPEVLFRAHTCGATLVTVVVPRFPRRSGQAKGGRLSVVPITLVALVPHRGSRPHRRDASPRPGSRQSEGSSERGGRQSDNPLVDPVTLAIHAAPAFVASAVEFVEATTIVLAVGVTRGWRAPLVGTIAATATLAVIIATLGVAIVTIVPELLLKGVVGALLLLFGLRWLRKAVLRFAGIVAIHDEELIYQRELAELRAQGLQRKEFDWIGFLVAYKAVLLEGTEVAFIVIAFGAAGGTALTAATVGAIAAGVFVIVLGAALRQPLTMVPENWLKFGVGAMLCSFGVFWFAEALGMSWPGDALSIPLIVVAFLAASWLAVRMLRALLPEGARVEARNV